MSVKSIKFTETQLDSEETIFHKSFSLYIITVLPEAIPNKYHTVRLESICA